MFRNFLVILHFGLTFSQHSQDEKAIQQKIECFDQLGCLGLSETFPDAISDLADYSFDEKISSCRATGSWILYADLNFNSEDVSMASYWIFGEDICLDVPDLFDNQASSLRFAGSKADWCFASINLYYGPYFSGYESEWIFKDQSSLGSIGAQSMIVSGSSAWTLHQLEDYQGQAVCVYPSTVGAYLPEFYTNYGMVVGSIRKGCFLE